MAIKIDLCDLTEAHLEEALPHMGACKYASPCIIGTLMPKNKAASLDRDNTNIAALIAEGRVEMPEGQANLATRLQKAFDDRSPHFKRTFRSVVKAAHKLRESAA